MSSTISSCSYLDIGGRDEQQDACISLDNAGDGISLHVLSDGVGGHSGGRLASKAVISVSEELWESQSKLARSDPRAFLFELASKSHERINEIAGESNTRARGTLVALLLTSEKAFWIHSGDSRLYHFRNGKRITRTFDHSVVQILLERGKITEEEMGTHPDQGRLLQSLGGEDFEDPEFEEVKLAEDGDVFLLCSDGFWERLEREELERLSVLEGVDCEKELVRLSKVAVKRGGEKADNLSVILVRPAGTSHRSMAPVVPWVLSVVAVAAGIGFAIALRERFPKPVEKPVAVEESAAAVEKLDPVVENRVEEQATGPDGAKDPDISEDRKGEESKAGTPEAAKAEREVSARSAESPEEDEEQETREVESELSEKEDGEGVEEPGDGPPSKVSDEIPAKKEVQSRARKLNGSEVESRTERGVPGDALGKQKPPPVPESEGKGESVRSTEHEETEGDGKSRENEDQVSSQRLKNRDRDEGVKTREDGVLESL